VTSIAAVFVLLLQVDVVQGLMQHGLWEDWEEHWAQQAEMAQVYTQAQLSGGTWVTSRSYTRHQTRNASRVLVALRSRDRQNPVRPYVAEVEYYVQLRKPAGEGVSSSSSGTSDVQVVAMLRVLATKVPDANPVADVLLMAEAGVYQQRDGADRVRAVPLQHIQAALHACCTNVGGKPVLTVTPVVSRSTRVAFR
jgi:hypothetical protein